MKKGRGYSPQPSQRSAGRRGRLRPPWLCVRGGDSLQERGDGCQYAAPTGGVEALRGDPRGSERLGRTVLPVLLAALALEPVLVLLAVGHGSAFEGLSCGNLLIGQSYGLIQVGIAQVGPGQGGPAQVGPAQVGPAQVGTVQ